MNIDKIYGDLPTIETKRLILRKIKIDDIEEMYAYGSDKEVAKYVTWETHKSIDDTKQFVEFVLNKYKNKQVAPWGIEYKENGKFIGTIDFVWWEPNNKGAEIGYAISKDYWGKGLTTEAAKEVVKFGFEKMDLVRIQAKSSAENLGSQRVMEKVGMTFEGTLRKAIFLKGKHQDLKMYSILKEGI